jgi:hypothetical protein
MTKLTDDGLRWTRRKLLVSSAAVATGGAMPCAAAGEAGGRDAAELGAGLFGRFFPMLPSFAEPSRKLNEAMLELGAPGGILDARDDLAAGPVELIANPVLSLGNPNNPAHTAGVTFVGQFMDHDLTFDLASRLGQPTRPRTSPNGRTAAFDLDSVYGGGPHHAPELYDATGRRGPDYPTSFRVGYGGKFEDLPRHADTMVAIVADPRNDENLLIAGLHAAFLKFHNRVVDHLSAETALPPRRLFKRARRLTRWHYQWMILHEFLPQFVGQSLVDAILANGRTLYRPSAAFIPVEFQAAAYRFGHSMVRPSYRANLAGDANGQPLFGMIFDPTAEGSNDPADLRGGARAPRRFVGWQTFFDFGGPFTADVRPNKLIDAKISTPLFHLPIRAIAGAETGVTALPQRNLLRHVTWRLPSGQSIARHLKVPALAAADLAELSDIGPNLDTSTPLWYYTLKEAQIVEGGVRLGPVGGRIVGEVIVGLLRLDDSSFLSAPQWRPMLPTRSGKVTGDSG